MAAAASASASPSPSFSSALDLPPEAIDELKEMLARKASDLFSICDQEDKGFVTKRDMQRMRGELPLDPDQLEAVFDTLDNDHNGYLTLEEFTEGFGQFLGLGDAEAQGEVVNESMAMSAAADAAQVDTPSLGEIEANHGTELSDEDEFNLLLSELGILGLVDDDLALRDMWLNLKKDDDPVLMSNFEALLSKMSRDLRKKSAEQDAFEHTLKSKHLLEEENLQHLYDEMEQQLTAERQRIREEEEKKELKVREELAATLQQKDQQLREVTQTLQKFQDQLEMTRKAVPEMLDENEQLAKERDRLRQEVERQRILMRDLQDNMDNLRHSTQKERKERAQAAFKVSENIAQEREGLVQQLNVIKTINAKMLDDQDIVDQTGDAHSKEKESGENLSAEMMSSQQEDASAAAHDEDIPRPAPRKLALPPLASDSRGGGATSEIECDDDYFVNTNPVLMSSVSTPFKTTGMRGSARRFRQQHSQDGDNVSLLDELAESGPNQSESTVVPKLRYFGETSSEDESGNDKSVPKSRASRKVQNKNDSIDDCRFSSSLLIYTSNAARTEGNSRQDTLANGSTMDSMATSCAGPMSFGESEMTSFNDPSSAYYHHHVDGTDKSYVYPLSRQQTSTPGEPGTLYKPMRHPERVFKIVFIGDTCVGKSSLILRFCTGNFRPGLKSTIGVDFQTRSLLVDGQSICMQCWDTAGQERYRSITKQYFRKADAVIVVYDITSEKSYLNAREWLNCAVDGAGEDASLLLLGNKLDLAQDDLMRKVRKSDGLQLSRQYSTLFGEVSASDGSYVEQTLADLAKLLREREDMDMQNALKLTLDKSAGKGARKKKCC